MKPPLDGFIGFADAIPLVATVVQSLRLAWSSLLWRVVHALPVREVLEVCLIPGGKVIARKMLLMETLQPPSVSSRRDPSHSLRCDTLFDPAPPRRRAFTRLELLAVLTGVFLLLALAAPALCSGRSGSQLAACFNHLRLMGQGVQSWGSEHNELPPWATRVSDGGTRPIIGSKPGNAWIEYAFLSNYLVTPKILACPADEGVKVAADWAGFTTIGFRSLALSYNLDLHSTPDRPRSVVSTDLNLRFVPGVVGCSLGVNTAVSLAILPSPLPDTYWTNAVHGLSGQLLMTDGSVELTDSAAAGAILSSPAASRLFHFLKAR